ncbi:MAG: signal recognition particle protein [Ignavibacteria bacterium RIFCSPLOWO2_02_FULL_55_14]|nr:MAG: signal recognition particle protein [Ignavibacteria bacterium GWC2_56_12]OGU74021.1 MAG: signal recognition particle protein [Ignavibacteria bacterium RIFCSPLOWO2_02_FULL_55_14]OGU75538.1 MAG: signal recognition particle protein [Ignavibacteria bacterium RIFCSPLOWO2_12_FULL_56_21]HAV22483.1 signal recognition particle protein [Bacteroidota bacterium]
MFENLSQKLEAVFRKLRGQGRLTPENIDESLREVRRALLDADVNFLVVRDFIEEVRKRALGQEVLSSVTPGQLIVKIIHDEMVRLLGSVRADIVHSQNPPTVILVAGLQGSGKTTFSAKLARLLASKGNLPLLVAVDVYRPAAIDQLEALGRQIGIPVFSDRTTRDAVAIARAGVVHAQRNVRDTVIIDTAGRLHIDEEMMREVEAVRDAVHPHETLFVVDAMTGQDAVTTARTFNERLGFDGIVLTKLDGDARGGAALSIRSIVQKPVKFVGTGEKTDALEPFHPDRMASRILGMGDIVTLVEKAQQSFNGEQAVRLQEKLRKSSFTLMDFLEQLREMRKMGPIDQVMAMVPGMSRMQGKANVDERDLVRIEAMILSMTPHERERPAVINGSRRRRIALGSGTTVQHVNRLLKQFDDMQKLMKKFSKGGLRRGMQGFRLPMG